MFDRMFSFLGDQMGITVTLNIVVPVIIVGVVGGIVFAVLSRDKENKGINPQMMAIIFVAAFGVVFAAIAGFAGFRAWYLSTGYLEVNHPYPKAQEAAYAKTALGAINNKGLEPNVSSRKNARKLKNPVPASAQSLREGKNMYLTYCKPCHGSDGGGQGIMGSVPMLRLTPPKGEVESLKAYLGNFTGSEPEFDIQFVQHESDGDIFYTITNGGEAIMPSFKDAMSPDQRWSLVNYIKKELGKPNVSN